MNNELIQDLNLNKLTIKDLTLLLDIIEDFENSNIEEIEVL